MIGVLLLAACITWTAPVGGAAGYRVRPNFSPTVDTATTTWCSAWDDDPSLRVCVSALNAAGTEGGSVCLSWVRGAVWDEVDGSRLPGCPINDVVPTTAWWCHGPIGGRTLWPRP